MNNHKIACLILVVLIGALGYGVNVLRTKASAAKEEAESTKQQAEAAEQQTQVAGIKLKSIDSKTAELRNVYSEWLPHFQAFSDPQEGERRISELVREGDVFLISQKFTNQKLDKDAVVSQALSAELVFEDDYTKVMNWLGKLEEALPSSRITTCVITRGDRGNDINVNLKLQVPIFKS